MSSRTLSITIALLGALLPSSASAITVTSIADSGPGSLRQAIADATSPGIIVFDSTLSGSTLTLSGSQLIIAKNLTIDASSLPRGLTIDAGGQSRIFNVQQSIGTPQSLVTLKSLTLTGGNGGAQGGAIRNTGILRIENCTLTRNTATSGGAIYNAGINQSSGVAEITIVSCTIAHNESGDNGGAIYNDGAGESISATLTLTNCTITNNTAKGSGDGGGIFHFGRNGTANLNLRNTIIAQNSAGGLGPDCRFDSANATVNDTNFVGTTAGTTLGGNTNILTGTPLLAPLGFYGGPTQTMHPLAGSPAILGGNATPRTDQRGFPLTGPPTIGAVKLGLVTTVENTADSGSGSLRQAIDSAPSQGSVIRFSGGLDASTITLSSTHLSIPSSADGLFIDASNLTNGITIDANASRDNRRRVMFVDSGATLALYQLTLTGGWTNGTSAGGSIFTGPSSNLTLLFSTVSDNRTGSGSDGGDGPEGGNGGRGGNGGGIFAEDGATLTLSSSTIRDNFTGNGGDGGDSSKDGLINFRGLGGSGGDGGGIFIDAGATLIISSSTISDNFTGLGGNAGLGGGSDGSDGDGGGVFINTGSTLTISSSTISNNATSRDGGGIFLSNSTTDTSIENSIVAGNTAADTDDNIRGEIDILLGDNLTAGDPRLSPLGDYGGPTQTMLPLPGSLAIDAATASTRTTDQRSFPITDASPDIGATEAPNWSTPTPTELASVFNTDFDADGNLYGLEILLGTDPFTHDLSHPNNFALTPEANGVTFGRDQSISAPYQLELHRSFDLLTFEKVYTYSTSTHTEISHHPDLTPDLSDPARILLPDSTQPRAFYQLGIAEE